MSSPAHLPRSVHGSWERLEQRTTSDEHFDPSTLDGLPAPVLRWLRHSIAAGTSLRRSARLWMHGDIRVSRWMPFTAQQVLAPEGFIWAAEAGRFPMRIRGFDRFCEGTGEMRWKLAGVVPVMVCVDDDTARSAAGRLAGETMLLPGGALGANVRWHEGDHHHATATVVTGSFSHDVTVSIDDAGRLSTVTLARWGNPDKGAHSEHLFGVEMSGEHAVDGYLLPATLRAGWWYGSDRWTDGEFYRAELDRAELF